MVDISALLPPLQQTIESNNRNMSGRSRPSRSCAKNIDFDYYHQDVVQGRLVAEEMKAMNDDELGDNIDNDLQKDDAELENSTETGHGRRRPAGPNGEMASQASRRRRINEENVVNYQDDESDDELCHCDDGDDSIVKPRASSVQSQNLNEMIESADHGGEGETEGDAAPIPLNIEQEEDSAAPAPAPAPAAAAAAAAAAADDDDDDDDD
ncbi:hypothetical protein ACHAWC_011527, partial [Mediolabrus comicus]